MKKSIKIQVGFSKRVVDAEVMTSEGFRKIKGDRDTPEFVLTENGLVFNEYTCLSAVRYGGTCDCFSHPTKRWIKWENYELEDGDEEEVEREIRFLKDKEEFEEVEKQVIREGLPEDWNKLIKAMKRVGVWAESWDHSFTDDFYFCGCFSVDNDGLKWKSCPQLTPEEDIHWKLGILNSFCNKFLGYREMKVNQIISKLAEMD